MFLELHAAEVRQNKTHRGGRRRDPAKETAAILTQAALIFWLLYEHWRRQRAEILARNTMSELSHVNRLATAGQLSASIAHEVNQPLAGIVANAQAALRWLEKANVEEVREGLKRIVSDGHRASDIIDRKSVV